MGGGLNATSLGNMNNSLKTCPFCKNQIPVNSEVCPVPTCQMVLIERCQTNFTKSVLPQYNSIFNDKEPELKAKPKPSPELDYFDDWVGPRFDKFYNFIKNPTVLMLGVLFIVVFIVILSSNKTDNDPQRTIYNNEINNDLQQNNQKQSIPNDNISQNTSPEKSITVAPNKTTKPELEIKTTPGSPKKEVPEIFYANGNVFERDKYYLSGLGQLKIKNGTSNDAVAKLVNLTTRRSVLTVYIRRNSNLNLSKIRDGNYRLYFVLGRRYDAEQNIFMDNCSFSVFEEAFDFNTYSYNVSDGVETNYSVFEVTLHPVVGGTARTSSVSKNEFLSF